MIDILYIDVPNEYVSRTNASLFVAQIVRTANEMSSTDNGTPTNKSINNNNKTNKDMFNQKEYNKCANFEIILGVISMIIMTIIVLM